MPGDDSDIMKNAPTMLSDEEMRKLLVPNPASDEQLLSIIKEHYDLPTVKVARRLDSYDDANYMLQTDDGTNYLLKIHNGVESQEFIGVMQESDDFYAPGRMNSAIHLQNAIMELCYEHGLCTSRPILVKTETAYDEERRRPKAFPVCIAKLPVLSSVHSPRDLVVRLLTWVPGTPMSSVVHLPLEALADAGRYLGKMDRILDNINTSALNGALRHVGSSAALLGQRSTSFVMVNNPSHAPRHDSFLAAVATASRKRSKSLDRVRANLGMEEREGAVLDVSLLVSANRYHQWDTKNTSDLRKYLEYITDLKRRDMIESVINAFEERLFRTGVGDGYRRGVIHGDFNDANVIMDEAQMMVCGAIDFGDSVMSWRVLDVAIAMAYAMLSSYGKQNRSLSAAAGFLRGYNSVYQLTELEREHLPLLMACRLACSVTLGAYAFHMHPTNKYLLLHAEPAWKSLEMIWGYDPVSRDRLADAARRLFDQACLYSDSREKIVTCYDLVIPDPSVADLLASVRVASIETISEPDEKRQRTKGDGLLPIIILANMDPDHFAEASRLLQSDQSDNSPRLEYQLEKRDIELPAANGDFIASARNQCAAAVEIAGCAAIIEITGLCFGPLNELPGTYTQAFLDTCGIEGLAKMLFAFDDKAAYVRAVVCFCPGPGNECVFFDGRTIGSIVAPRGENGFGLDSIFEPSEGGGKTYAEMKSEEKDALSHRARAFNQLQTYLRKFRIEIASQL
ncbi:hypothetical protein MPSEU_000473600 [Mayamaea pseudoterrestris]|nr:hypothetical protein MPSEU_000473600 [Mayamaea pseudoterrestris]